MRYSVISIFFILVSCSPKTLRILEPTAVSVPNYTTHYFSDSSTDYVYKAAIEVYGNNLGGILIAKKIMPDTHRIVFTTEFGNKLFDFELSRGAFKVNFIIDELNRPLILKTLKNDFRLLFQEVFVVDGQFRYNEQNVYKSTDGNRQNFLFTDKTTGLLHKLVHSTRTKDKIIIEYLPETSTFAAKILVAHRNIPLKIALNSMDY